MMKQVVLLICMGLAGYIQAQKAPFYEVHVDLTQVRQDKVPVTYQLEQAPMMDTLEFQFPKIVPGTYSISDFGRFVSDFQAFDAKGQPLQVEQVSVNRYQLIPASKLHRITYWVDDTFDARLRPTIFEPGGTNIEEEQNFVINPFGFFGYLEGHEKQSFGITFTKPEGFYGATALIPIQTSDTADVFVVSDYHLLADSPLLYALPDTVTREIGGAEVLVAVYSPNERIEASQIMDMIDEILLAQKDYLGGDLPVNKYAFLMYFTESGTQSGGVGALEHSYSSLYVLPEMNAGFLEPFLKDVAAHEFYHIITPLQVHSHEIDEFNFIEPDMSKHLWLYEGVTEYAANHSQVYQGLISPEQFLKNMQQKMVNANNYSDTLPFTVMSEEVLTTYHNEYPNVYEKGALIGMAIDLKLRILSDGAYGLPDLMNELTRRYGKSRAFDDDALFSIIAEITYPEMRSFLDTYVGGNQPLPLQELLEKVGVHYQSKTRDRASLGNVAMGFNQKESKLEVQNISELNAFGKEMGYKKGDLLVSVNGVEIEPGNAVQVLTRFGDETKEGDPVTVVVLRPNKKGAYKEKTLSAPAILVKGDKEHELSINPQATQDQIALREAWLRSPQTN